MSKDIVISGIKPSGELHLGTLLGAILPFAKYQEKYGLNIFIADVHTLTKPIEPDLLRKYTEDLIVTYLCYLDPAKVTLFKQSDIPAHAQLSQILTCYLDVADLTKMPQYKNYCDTHKGEAVPAGMLDYVNWMNADILLYSPDCASSKTLKVICGQDQLPHIYLCKEVAKRFNKLYGNTFKLPEPIMTKTGAKIMSLSDPTKKMSKSESDKGTIYLFDDEQAIRNKIKKALTDSEDKVYYNPETKPGVSNLMTIYSALTNKTFEEIKEEFKDIPNYGVFKNAVADVVWNELKLIQEKIAKYKADKDYISTILNDGADRAKSIADKKIEEVYMKVGLR